MTSLSRHYLQLCRVLHVLCKQSKISSNVFYFILEEGQKGERKGDNANQTLKCLPKLLNLTLIYNKETDGLHTYGPLFIRDLNQILDGTYGFDFLGSQEIGTLVESCSWPFFTYAGHDVL